jgi:hypothetical protein
VFTDAGGGVVEHVGCDRGEADLLLLHRDDVTRHPISLTQPLQHGGAA